MLRVNRIALLRNKIRAIEQEIAHLESLESAASDILSVRQLQVVQLIADGRTNSKICEILGLSDRTVNRHRQIAMTRIGAHSVAEVRAWWLKTKNKSK